MNEDISDRLKEIKIEDIVWIIYIGIIILSFYSNELEKNFFYTKNPIQKEKYRKILILIFSILLIVYLYFVKDSLDSVKKLSPHDSIQKQNLTYLALVASTLILISGVIFLYIAIKDENIDVELAFNWLEVDIKTLPFLFICVILITRIGMINMLDINYLKQNNVDIDTAIELFGDISIYNETCQDFLDGIDEKLAELKKYKDAADMPNYAIYAHSIKSDARYLGFTEIAKIALDHEMAGKGNDERFVMKEYDNLVAAANKMIAIVKEYLGQSTPSATPSQSVTSEKEDVVLIADDSKLVTNFVVRSIGDSYKTIVAYDGVEVIDIINNYPNYNIIALFLDLNMPRMGGFEVLEYFKEHNLLEKIPVSIITGEDSKEMINKAFSYNICDMLVKPFNAVDVKRVTDKTVNFHRN